MKTKWIAFSTILLMAGCGASLPIQTGLDTYSVTSSGAGFSTDGVKADVYEAANKHCTGLNRQMVEVSLKTQDGALGRNPPSADLTFKCLAQGDPEIQRRGSGQNVVLIPAMGQPPSSDRYAELKKLKELLDSGALTQKEFDEQKAKILSRQ